MADEYCVWFQDENGGEGHCDPLTQQEAENVSQHMNSAAEENDTGVTYWSEPASDD